MVTKRPRACRKRPGAPALVIPGARQMQIHPQWSTADLRDVRYHQHPDPPPLQVPARPISTVLHDVNTNLQALHNDAHNNMRTFAEQLQVSNHPVSEHAVASLVRFQNQLQSTPNASKALQDVAKIANQPQKQPPSPSDQLHMISQVEAAVGVPDKEHFVTNELLIKAIHPTVAQHVSTHLAQRKMSMQRAVNGLQDHVGLLQDQKQTLLTHLDGLHKETKSDLDAIKALLGQRQVPTNELQTLEARLREEMARNKEVERKIAADAMATVKKTQTNELQNLTDKHARALQNVQNRADLQHLEALKSANDKHKTELANLQSRLASMQSESSTELLKKNEQLQSAQLNAKTKQQLLNRHEELDRDHAQELMMLHGSMNKANQEHQKILADSKEEWAARLADQTHAADLKGTELQDHINKQKQELEEQHLALADQEKSWASKLALTTQELANAQKQHALNKNQTRKELNEKTEAIELHKKELAEMRAQMEAVGRNHDKVLSEAEQQWAQKYAAKEQELSQSEADAKAKQSEMDAVTSKHQELQHQLQTSLTNHQAEVARLQGQLNDTVSLQAKQQNDWSGKLHEVTASLQQAQDNAASKQKQIADMQDVQDSLRGERESATRREQAAVEEHGKALAELQEKLEGAHKNSTAKQKQLDNYASAEAALRQQLKNAQAEDKVGMLQSNLDKLKSVHQDGIEKVNALTAELKSAQLSKNNAEKSRQELLMHEQQLQSRLDQLEKGELVQSHALVAELQAQVTAMKSSAQADESSLKIAHEQLAAAEELKKQQEAQLTTLLAQAADGDQKTMQIQQLQLQVSEDTAKIAASNKAMEELEKKVKDTEELRGRLQNEFSDVKTHSEELKAALATKDHVLEDLQEKLTLAHSQADAQAARYSALSNNSEKVKTQSAHDLAASQQVVKELEDKLQEQKRALQQEIDLSKMDLLKAVEHSTASDNAHKEAQEQIKALLSKSLTTDEKVRGLEDDVQKHVQTILDKDKELENSRTQLKESDSKWKAFINTKEAAQKETEDKHMQHVQEAAANHAKQQESIQTLTQEIASSATKLHASALEIAQLKHQHELASMQYANVERNRNLLKTKVTSLQKELNAAHEELRLRKDMSNTTAQKVLAHTNKVENSLRLERVEVVRSLLTELIQHATKAQDGQAGRFEKNQKNLNIAASRGTILERERLYKQMLRAYKNTALVHVIINTFDIKARMYKPLPKGVIDINGSIVTLSSDSQQFKYTSFASVQVWDLMNTAASIYSRVVHETVLDCLNGGSSVVFTYGQSGSGKSSALFGDLSTSGMAAQALSDLKAAGRVEHHRTFFLYGVVAMRHIISSQTAGPRATDFEQKQYAYLADPDILVSKTVEIDRPVFSKGQPVSVSSIRSSVSAFQNELVSISFGKHSDKTQVTAPMVRPTPNNMHSSRAHLFMTWKVTAAGGKEGYLTLVDMAGAEDPRSIAKMYALQKAHPGAVSEMFTSAMRTSSPIPDEALVLQEGFFVNESLNQLADFFYLEQHHRIRDKRVVLQLDGGWSRDRIEAYRPSKSLYTNDMVMRAYKDSSRDPFGMMAILQQLKNLGSASSSFTMLAITNPNATTGMGGVKETLDFAARM